MSILDAPGISQQRADQRYVPLVPTDTQKLAVQQAYGLQGNLTQSIRSLGEKPGKPVTATVTLGTVSGITNVKAVGAAPAGVIDLSSHLYSGMNPQIAGPLSPKVAGIVGNNLTSSNGGSAGVRVENSVDSRFIEYPIRCNGQAIKITIEGTVVVNVASDRTTGTAQTGGASTITLAAGDAGINGGYQTQYIIITGGTGIGQIRQITIYNSTTKVATVSSPWATTPDATSTYRINVFPNAFSIPSDNSLKYITIDTGVRSRRRTLYESTAYWLGISVDSSGSVTKPVPITSMRAFFVGDSFGEGAGAAYGPQNSYPHFLAARYGWEPWHLSAGGTGFLANNGNARLKYRDRILPPINAWIINTWAVSAGGTFVVAQGGLSTSAIAWNASYIAVQAAFDTTFGVGSFKVVNHPYYGLVAIGLGAKASVTLPMTVIGTGLTGAISTFQFVGDIAPNVPLDVNGNAMPFIIFLQGSLNDDGQTGLQAEAETLYAACCAKWPTAFVLASGRQMNNGPVGLQNQRDNNAALVAASAQLRLVNGRVPFAATFNSASGIGYLTGQTTIATAAGVSGVNSDTYVWIDQTHYTTQGYEWLAEVYGAGLDPILLNLSQ
jgi:hypothetical protein